MPNVKSRMEMKLEQRRQAIYMYICIYILIWVIIVSGNGLLALASTHALMNRE